MIKAGKRIIPQMFDVRPVDKAGDLDWKKIGKVKSILIIKDKPKKHPRATEKSGPKFSDIKHPDAIQDEIKRFQKIIEQDSAEDADVYQLGQKYKSASVPVFYETELEKSVATLVVKKNWKPQAQKEAAFPQSSARKEKDIFIKANDFEFLKQKRKELLVEEAQINYFDEIKDSELYVTGKKPEKTAWKLFFRPAGQANPKKFVLAFAGVACLIFLSIFGAGVLYKGLSVKNSVLSSGENAYASLAKAQAEIADKNFQGSSADFSQAYDNFGQISSELNDLGGILTKTPGFIPFLSKLSSGSRLAQAGQDISQIGILSGNIMQTLNAVKNPLDSNGDSVSLLKIFRDTSDNAKKISDLLSDAQQNLAGVNTDDIPEAQRAKFVDLKNKLPEINSVIQGFVGNNQIFTDVLGGNGSRKYLFLFQNNQEMRATGGFIGTYGVLDIGNGRVKKFFVDGVFNPDGQLQEKIVPPAPIQKISAAWSLHDSNWFPNFPTSAEEAANFYEKTGGPTVDGVITMTPVVMQKLLEVTGPIDMPEYNIIIDKDNFVQAVQQEVEVDYDKELNQPKKILADLAPKILDKIFNARNASDIARTMQILSDSLNEKQILIYSKNYDIEKKLSELGWSGEMLDTQKDYLSVINTNINGYKTDGVIDEKIEHQAEIQDNGEIVDTVTITRHHNGGNSEFDWLNKVNADYMRVYVPQGSQLLSVEGQTREFDQPPLDYNALGFKRDPLVQMEEDSTKIDDASGTRIYDDSNKTVFANWVYVSPQETVTVKYKYLLPFKININNKDKPADTYSLLAQKQSGSAGSQLVCEISYPQKYNLRWNYPDNISKDGNQLKLETDLKTDKFVGIAFTQ